MTSSDDWLPEGWDLYDPKDDTSDPARTEGRQAIRAEAEARRNAWARSSTGSAKRGALTQTRFRFRVWGTCIGEYRFGGRRRRRWCGPRTACT